MTKKQALQEFKKVILPIVKDTYERDGIIDKPARREAWNDWTDGLCKQGEITRKQCDTWSNPF